MNRIMGLLMAAAVVLLTIWLYNHFSGKSVASLGAKTA